MTRDERPKRETERKKKNGDVRRFGGRGGARGAESKDG